MLRVKVLLVLTETHTYKTFIFFTCRPTIVIDVRRATTIVACGWSHTYEDTRATCCAGAAHRRTHLFNNRRQQRSFVAGLRKGWLYHDNKISVLDLAFWRWTIIVPILQILSIQDISLLPLVLLPKISLLE